MKTKVLPLLLGCLGAFMPALVTQACVGDSPDVTSFGDASGDAPQQNADGPSSTDSGPGTDSSNPTDAGPGAVCEAGAQDCLGSQPRTCVNGQWTNATACTDEKPICVGGACASPPSCATLLTNCGANPEPCCTSPIAQGATFNRFDSVSYPATVSSVRLNEFEVTVARFRAFAQSGRGNAASPPPTGSGAHPKIANSGWQAAFNASLLADQATLESTLVSCDGFTNATYSSVPQIADQKPLNCATWFEAFAFCIWDGGRLPTVAELELATRGGVQQRGYPWGNTLMDPTHAYYCPNDPDGGYVTGPCSTPSPAMLDVGTLGQGTGRFGHLDLYGSMREYTLDIYMPIPTTCVDCAQLDTSAATTRGAVGGSWADTIQEYYDIFNKAPTTSTHPRTPAGGFRCAYDL